MIPQERSNDEAELSPLMAFSPMPLHGHRGSGPLIGRPVELTAIDQEISSTCTGRLVGLTLEGEPGIGKTRLLLAAREQAERAGMTVIAVAADEELRGPFLVARSIMASPEAVAAATGGPAHEPLARCLAAMSGEDDPGLANLPADQRVLRTFDLGAVAFRALAGQQGLAVLIDDVQWADDDSLRLLRYVVRANATNPILLLFAIRPEEFALVTEAVNLIADMDRMGVVRRLRVNRFTPAETRSFLAETLDGPIDTNSASVMHGQAEGVPFMVKEMALAYRDSGMIQQIDGTWTLARNADRLVPSAVKTLISRRAAHLPDDTKTLLAEAAVLGRHFSLKDLREIELRVREVDADPDALSATLAPAVAGGLLDPARRGLRRRLQLPARTGAGVRVGDAPAGAATGDPCRDRGHVGVGRTGAGEPPFARASREGRGRRADLRAVLGRGQPQRARGERAGGGLASRRRRAAARRDAPGARRPAGIPGPRPRHAAPPRRPHAGIGRARRARRGDGRFAARARCPASTRRGAPDERGIRPRRPAGARGDGARGLA